ncbi:21 kDa protein-like [Ananas comosus]|uniref:21 kDa protein-like n=1 Tax=Ananas comosus TaxID=4615 RepID=A0A6P5FPT6_ANACO|nr:21 kDa protein-like [Ananas comosus]
MAAGGGMSRGEAAAVRDCVDMLGDAADELRESAEEMERMKEGRGSGTQEAERFEISNVQTWVSAALTNDDTCLEGFGGDLPSSVSELVRSQVVNVAQLTSNALFFINKLASFEP